METDAHGRPCTGGTNSGASGGTHSEASGGTHSEAAEGGRVVREKRMHDSLRSKYADGRVLRPKVRATHCVFCHEDLSKTPPIA